MRIFIRKDFEPDSSVSSYIYETGHLFKGLTRSSSGIGMFHEAVCRSWSSNRLESLPQLGIRFTPHYQLNVIEIRE